MIRVPPISSLRGEMRRAGRLMARLLVAGATLRGRLMVGLQTLNLHI